MKKYLLFCSIAYVYLDAFAQPNYTRYPEPEYSNEVYLLKKDSNKVIRLEKGSSKMNTKTKLGGMGGMENGYSMDGSRSSIRLPSGTGLTFVFSTGEAPDKKTSPQADSIMRATGLDPSMISMGSMMDPSKMITIQDGE